MSGWLLDTNVVGELSKLQSARAVQQWADAQRDADLYISILTIGEIEKGIAHLRPGDPRQAAFELSRDGAISRFAGRVLPVSDAIVRRWGVLSGEAKRRTRQTPPVIDTLLAATAIEHGLTLVTRNVADVRESGAALFDPWTGTVVPAGAVRG